MVPSYYFLQYYKSSDVVKIYLSENFCGSELKLKRLFFSMKAFKHETSYMKFIAEYESFLIKIVSILFWGLLVGVLNETFERYG